MKKINNFLLTMLLCTGQVVANDSDTHRGGNGGNSIAGHFTTIASNIAYVWEDICLKAPKYDSSCDNLDLYKELISNQSHRKVTVKSQEQVFAYDDQEREAINDGNSLITVSESKWMAMNQVVSKSSRRTKLVMHEFFTILGTDFSDFYNGSNKVMGLIARNLYNLDAIASDELLPSRCSVSIKGNAEKTLKDQLTNYLTQKNYDVSSKGEKTRYTLELNTECIDTVLHNSCTLVGEITDNIREPEFKNEKIILNDAYMFMNIYKLQQRLLYNYQSKIETCQL